MTRRRVFNAVEAKAAVVRHWRELSLQAQVNMVEYTAQQHEVEAVELLATFMLDQAMPFTFRRECAKDIVIYARGAPRPWVHDGMTVEPTAIGGTGHLVSDEVMAIQATTDLHRKLSELMMRGVHPSQWPEDIRRVAGDLLEYYEEQDEILEAKVIPVTETR